MVKRAFGLFITFEGGEGAGKTTQIEKLKQKLQRRGIKVLTTREPGGCPSAELIRDLLVTGSSDKWAPMTELMLLFAGRYEHYIKVIKPALDEKKVVLCDRFYDSTMAYQGYAMGLGRAQVEAVQHLTLGDFKPDLTFIFDLDPKLGLSRTQERTHDENRYEGMDLSFHEKIRAAFLGIAKHEQDRCVVINAANSIDEIQESLLHAIDRVI